MEKTSIVIKPRFYLIIILVFATIFTIQFFKANKTIIQQSAKISTLDASIEAQTTKNEELNYKLESYSNNDMTEQTAREQLGWISEDETLYVKGN